MPLAGQMCPQNTARDPGPASMRRLCPSPCMLSKMRARAWGTGFVLMACAAFELWLFSDQCIDDAFISFRYVDNLVHHGVLAYNLGEPPVEGFSNPLWVLLNIPGAWLGAPLAWARVLGLVCLMLHVGLLVRMSNQLGLERFWPVSLTLGLCLSAPGFVYWHFAGLETALVSLLVTASFCLFQVSETRTTPWLGPLLATLALTRIDAALTAVLVVCACVLSYGPSRERIVRALGALAWVFAALAVLEVARVSYFGELLPNTYYAKVDGHVFDDAGAGLAYLLQPFGHTPLLFAGLTLPLWSSLRKGNLAPIVWAFWFVLVLQLVYIVAVGGDWMPLYRFFMPFIPIAALLSTVTLQRLFAKACALGVNDSLFFGLCLLIAPGGLLGYLLTDEPLSVQMGTELSELGKDLGLALAKTFPAGTLTANGAAGSAPYYARFDNIDLGGLNDRVIAHAKVSRFASFLPKGHRKGEGRYVLSRKPDVLVFVQGRSKTPGFHPADAQIAFEPGFHAHYERVALVTERPAATAGWVLVFPERGEGFLTFAGLEATPALLGTRMLRRNKLELQVFRRTSPPTSGPRALFAHVAELASKGQTRAAADELEAAVRRSDMGAFAPVVHPMLGALYLRAGDPARASTHFAVSQRVLPPEWMELFQLWLRTDPSLESLVATSLQEN